jgi:hypothetical protein
VGPWTEPSDIVMVLYQVSLVTVRGEDEAAENTLNVSFSGVEKPTSGCDMALQVGEDFLESGVEGLQPEGEVPQEEQGLYRESVPFAGDIDL